MAFLFPDVARRNRAPLSRHGGGLCVRRLFPGGSPGAHTRAWGLTDGLSRQRRPSDRGLAAWRVRGVEGSSGWGVGGVAAGGRARWPSRGSCLPDPEPTGSLQPGLLPLLPPEAPPPRPPLHPGQTWGSLTAPRLEPRPPQAWLLRGSLSPRLPTTLAHLGLWRSPWFRCFVSSPFLGLSFLTRGGARDAAGRPRPPERAGLSPGLAPNCCREGGCRPGLESWVGSGGQSAHRWAAPPALLGPEGAREGQGRGQGLGVPGASQGRRPHLPSPEGAQPGESRAPWSVRERVSLWGPPPSTARGQEWGTSTHTRPPWL